VRTFLMALRNMHYNAKAIVAQRELAEKGPL